MKNCPLCGNENGLAAQACMNCAYPFAKTPDDKPMPEQEYMSQFRRSGHIFTPAGKPPYTPKNIENPTEDDLREWIENILDSNLDYAPQAVLYFSQRFWPFGGEVYRRIKAMLLH